MDTAVRDRIKKLLALGKSPNQNEANYAILKAKKMMVEYKLTERDVLRKDEIPIKVDTNIYYTTRKEHWMTGLADVIAENNCCVFFMITPPGSQKHYIIFYGYEEDASICTGTFAYAVDCIRSQLKQIVKTLKDEEKTGTEIRSACESFGKGFYEGLEDIYHIQEEENQEWGLVTVVPPEVAELLKDMKHAQHQEGAIHQDNESLYIRGYREGKTFTIQNKLEGPEL
ncbi:DUF2786 domain-containing protein [Acetobacterium bakii]|uniref:Uncharacterized protein n=1 Tax=Acetobacterium bakii TaxID=52689 RepID=A0A0L6U0T3_9FIRM|nr:DUF2786 domain-containing protein [Acetobacterium bakii]KNZ41405.1 hypothetical protein AKG39_12370 [Acetobacterium bakii]